MISKIRSLWILAKQATAIFRFYHDKYNNENTTKQNASPFWRYREPFKLHLNFIAMNSVLQESYTEHVSVYF